MTVLNQPAFTGGVLAPSLQARIDITKYATGAKTMRNMFCHAHGGVSNRAGSYMVTEVKDSSKTHRLIPFVYNSDQTYALELGDNTIRFIAESGGVHGLLTLDIVESGTYKWSASGSGTNEYYMELDAGGDPGIMETFSVIEDSTAMTEGTAGSLSAGEWVWDDNDSLGYETVYVRLTDNADPDAKPDGFLYTNIEIVSPYGESDLAELNYTQSADVMYISHPSYYPRKLSRLSNTSWTIAEIDIGDGPYRSRDSDDAGILLTPAARIGNNIAVTASATFFNSKHVGSPLRIGYINPLDSTEIKWGYGVIDQVTDSTNARFDITDPLGYEKLYNPRFELGLVGWEDRSDSTSHLTLNPADNTLTFNKGAAGQADARQEIEMVEGEKNVLSVNITAITGTLRVMVGTTTGAPNISSVSHTTTGVKTIDFIPTQEEIHITLDTAESSSGQAATVSEVSVTRKDLSTPEFRIGAWNETDGYPRAVGVSEQRLCFGGTLKHPLTQWLSKTGGFEDFSFESPVEDSDSFSFRFDTGQVNDIQWIISLGSMIVGTSGVEWKVQAGGNSDSLNPSSISAKAQSYNGCANMHPLIIGSSAVYIQRGENAVRDLAYSLEVDGFSGDNRSILANHLFEDNTAVEWAYARLPYSIIWVVRDDGKLLGLTYMKSQEVWGWHEHDTEGEYESICSTPGGVRDWVYTIVNRTIDGNTKRFIEVFMPRISDEDTYDYFFVDCGLTYSGVATETITGLDHLEGEDVSVLADGSVVPNKTVSGGSITIPTAATLVHVGLPFTSQLETLELHLQDDNGSSQGRTKSVPTVSIKFEKTRAAFAGPDSDHLDEIRFRDEAYGESPIPLITDDVALTLNVGYDTSGGVFIENVAPTPITVLAVSPTIVLSER